MSVVPYPKKETTNKVEQYSKNAIDLSYNNYYKTKVPWISHLQPILILNVTMHAKTSQGQGDNNKKIKVKAFPKYLGSK